MSNIAKITIVGDIMCLQEQNEAIFRKYGYYDYFLSLKPTSSLFEDSDYVIGNLETPICSKELSNSPISFNTPFQFLNAIKRIGINGVQTCNNHCLDRGIDGLIETLHNIKGFGLDHFGTYSNEEDCKLKNNVIILRGGIKIGILCCTYGTNSENNGNLLSNDELWRIDLLKKQNKKSRLQWTPEMGPIISKMIPDSVKAIAIDNPINQKFIESIQLKIQNLRKCCDFLIVMPHIGGQYNPAPGEYTKYAIKKLIDAGADIIIAGHPHVPLRTETINDVFVAYSLGNFCFTPGVGYYLPNLLAEYGIVLHVYYDIDRKTLDTITFSVVKNVVESDGITYTYPVYNLFNQLEGRIAKEELFIENEAIVNRVCGTSKSIEIAKEYKLL